MDIHRASMLQYVRKGDFLGKNNDKTNVMRILDQKKIPYISHEYLSTGAVSGPEVARALGEDPRIVFKTLVTVGKTGTNYVFVVPVEKELNLKVSFAKKEITVVKATKREKELLDMADYDLLVCVKSYTYLDDATLFEYTISKHRPDKFRFVDFARRSEL